MPHPRPIQLVMIITAGVDSRQDWFCLRSQPRREHVAAAHLRDRVGVGVFAPRIHVRKSLRSGRVADFAEPLFPGYLFARFRYREQWRQVVSTQGVSGVVSFGEQVPAVADGVIDYLRAQIATSDQLGPAPLFAAGAWVRIVNGCFRNTEGQVVHFDSRTERVRLLLTLLGREIQVSVPADRLVALSDCAHRYPPGLLALSAATAAPSS